MAWSIDTLVNLTYSPARRPTFGVVAVTFAGMELSEEEPSGDGEVREGGPVHAG